jgi:hypothetical protein
VCRVLKIEEINLMMSSDAQQDQIQIIKYQKHLKWNLVSRSSDSGQNCKVSEASEHEVKSRSSDSGETLSAPSELSRDQHQKQDSKILQKHKYSDYGFANHEEVTFKSSKDFQIDFLNRERDVNLHFQERRYYLW